MYSVGCQIPRETLKQIAHINHDAFGSDDLYNTPARIALFLVTGPGELMVEMGRNKRVLAYLFYKRTEKALESERLAVIKKARRKGVARSLLDNALARAKDLKLDYTTYTLHDNLASINMRYGMGFVVTKIDGDCIYFIKKYVEDGHE